MHRLANVIAVAVFVVSLPTLARAQEPDEAPAVLPPLPAQPACAPPACAPPAPVYPQVPPPYPPPCVAGYPCSPGYGAPLYAPGTVLEGDLRRGRIVVGADGSLWHERMVRRANAGVWATGLTLWTTSWLATVIGGAYGSHNDDWLPSMLPIFGAWGSAFIASNENRGGEAAGYAVSGLVQAAGFVMFVAGAASGKTHLERRPVIVTPAGVAGRF